MIRAAVEAVAVGEGRAVVVEGPAGIGKTALVAAAGASAREAGLTPLAARGTELERAFGFGVVRQLLEPAVHDGDAATAFEGAARQAAALLDVSLAEPASLPLGPEGAFAVLHGLYRLTANLARDRPLALLVDDAHWADAASLRFLAYLGGRLEPDARPARRRRAAARRAGRRRGRRDAGGGRRARAGAPGGAQRRRVGGARARRRARGDDGALPYLPRAHGREPVLPGRARGRAARGRPGSRRGRARRRARRRRRGGPGAARPFPRAAPSGSPARRRSSATAP